MNSSNSVSGASPSIAPPTRSFQVLLADGTRHRVTCGDLAIQLRQERTAALKRLRQARAEAIAGVADRVADGRIRREFEAGERAMDAAIRRLSKQVRVKPEKKRHPPVVRRSLTTQRNTGHGGLVLARRGQHPSALARRDRLNREGIMLRIRYVRAGGKHAAPGCLRRHWFYIAREAAVTLDTEGNPIVLGNLGETSEEIADGLDLQEQLLRAMRKNAKLSFRMIGAFPYGLPVDARREVLQRIGDGIFGARGLPWTGAAHDADAAAKVDNPHFHLDYAALPMARQADGSYIVSNDLRTDLDGQEGLRFIRHMVAQVMTEVAQEYGLDRTFTALSYRERGMDREGGEHIGQEGTAAHRRGEHVAAIERNDARRWLSESRERARRARERLEALELLKRAIAADAECPSLPMIPADVLVAAFIDEPVAPALPVSPDLAKSVQKGPAPQVPGPPETLAALAAAAPDINRASVKPFAAVPEAPAISATMPSIIDVADKALPEVAVLPLCYTVPIAPQIGPPPTFIAVGQSTPSLPLANGLFDISPEAPRFETPPSATALPRIPEMATINAVVPNIAFTAPAMTDLPAVIDISNLIPAPVLPMQGDITIVLLPAAVSSITPCPAIYSISVPTAPVLGVSTASLTHISGSAPLISSPPVVHDIGVVAPMIVALPPLVIIEDRAPLLVQVEVLHVISAAGDRIDAPPALVAVGKHLTIAEQMPPLSAVGQAAGPVPGMELALWKIGYAVAKNAEDDAIEQRLREATKRDAERSFAESRIALDQLFWAIREERHYVAAENGGRVVEPDLLARFGLTCDDVASNDVQRRLAAIAANQTSELSQIGTYVRESPNMVVKIGNHWVLAENAPEDMQDLVKAWCNDRWLQNALARVAATVFKPDSAQHNDIAAPRDVAGVAWLQARHSRENALARWDKVEQLERVGMERPGEPLARPGQATVEGVPPIARRYPGIAGSGLGD